MTILEFRGKNRFLSNFWQSPILLGGKVYPTIEHAYQASKTFNEAWREKIRNAGSPGQAKRLGRNMPIRSDWVDIKVGIMLSLVRLKFQSGSQLAKKLLATGDEYLIEGNTWHDNFWGCCDCGQCQTTIPQNNFGKILMKVRDELHGR